MTELENTIHVLVAEDNPDLRLIFSKVFQRAPFKVHAVEDGKMVIEYLQKIIPDVLIMDLNMPRLSGQEVLRHVRRNPKTKNIKVIIVTGNQIAADDDEVTLADLCLLKPVDVPELLDFAKRLSRLH